MSSILWTIVVSAGIPSAVIGFLIGRLNKQIEKRDKEKEAWEKARQKHEVMMIKLILVTLSLSEATAEAVQRIPDAHCNGDMHAALEEARRMKNEYRSFETEQVVKSLNN